MTATTGRSGPLLPLADPELAADVAAGLERVDTLLRQTVDHDDPFIAEASGHLLAAGGKRFRPMLVLLAAHLGPRGVTDDVVRAAASVELTHLASLYHDDVMDEAEMRRGAVSANARYGASTAILVGDLLFGAASSIVADLGPEAVKIQADTFVRLCAGQIRDDRPTPDGVDPIEHYLAVLADKTGVLIATAVRYGAMFAGARPETIDIVRAYGEELGVAFQLADDLLDVTGDARASGKAAGTDLREGVDTLTTLLIRRAHAPQDAELLALLDADLRGDEVAHARALSLVRAHPAVQQARDFTRDVAARARARLEPLGDSPAVSALAQLADLSVERVR